MLSQQSGASAAPLDLGRLVKARLARHLLPPLVRSETSMSWHAFREKIADAAKSRSTPVKMIVEVRVTLLSASNDARW